MISPAGSNFRIRGFFPASPADIREQDMKKPSNFDSNFNVALQLYTLY